MENLRFLQAGRKIRQYEIIDAFRALRTAKHEKQRLRGIEAERFFRKLFRRLDSRKSACRTGTPVRLVMFGLKYFAAASKLMNIFFAKNDDAMFVRPGFASESWMTTGMR